MDLFLKVYRAEQSGRENNCRGEMGLAIGASTGTLCTLGDPCYSIHLGEGMGVWLVIAACACETYTPFFCPTSP